MAHVPGVQSLKASRDQALHALLGSLSQLEASQNPSHNDSQLSAEQARKLADKLGELVGDVDIYEQQNENAEIVNEEGLPIIEVAEPLPDVNPVTVSQPVVIHNDLVPLSSLPMSERERRRTERDRILDLLEEEESIQQMENDAFVEEQRRKTLQKQKENAQREMERLKAAREIQKKMGKALLRNMADTQGVQEEMQREISCQVQTVEQQKKTINTKKNVSFAELPAGGSKPKEGPRIREEEVQLDWGDVAPGRLRSTNRGRLTTKAQMDKLPMKMDVVERLPQSRPEQSSGLGQDSDDESVHSSPLSEDSDEGVSFSCDQGDEPLHELRSASDGDGSEDDLHLEDEGFDFDTAHYHREIALAYYEKRNLIGDEAAWAMTSHTHDEGETDWNQPEVPLDATLSHSRPKSTMSRFKADRTAASHSSSASSTSLGSSVLPASGYQSLQRAIRTGRLENDTLVGGEAGESASEPEDVQTVLELLKKGEVYNAGPTLNSVVPSSASVQAHPSPLLPTGNIAITASSGVRAPVGPPASASKPKVSKFKLNRTQGSRALPGQRSLDPAGPNISPPLTRPSTNINGPDHAEATFISLPASTSHTSRSPSVPVIPTQFPTIIDPPSFPKTHQIPSSNLETKPRMLTASGRRPDRPPTVMSAAVLESTGGDNSGRNNRTTQQRKKVSRFLAERM